MIENLCFSLTESLSSGVERFGSYKTFFNFCKRWIREPLNRRKQYWFERVMVEIDISFA